MKFTIVVLLVIFSINLAGTVTVEKWGKMYNVQAIGFETATACRFIFKVQTRILTFPLKGQYNDTIKAIQHVNFYDPAAKGEIIEGGIGLRFVRFKLISRRGAGINSAVTVFGGLYHNNSDSF